MDSSPGARQERPTTIGLACVVLAHTDAPQVRRLIHALDPFPVFLHCDRSTPEDVFAAMVRDLPSRCTVLPRIRTGWARWENVAAELDGYRAALANSDLSHVAVLTGTDYPVVSTETMRQHLARRPTSSFGQYQPLPYEEWGPSGGFSRLRYRHWAVGKRMLRLPIPRRLPAGITLAGGSQLKVLSRSHARAVIDVADTSPALTSFFRRSWVPDETFIPSVLSTPRLVPDWAQNHVEANLWWIGWDGTRRKSPPWLTVEHLDAILASTEGEHDPPLFFARKFSTQQSGELADAIDARVRPAAGSS